MRFNILFGLLLLFVVPSVVAVSGASFVDSCYSASWSEFNSSHTGDLRIVNSCAGGSFVLWSDPVDLSILGDVVDGDVVITSDWVFVDSSLRPDLDSSATVVFRGHSFAVDPVVLVDGVVCGVGVCTDIRYKSGRIEVDVVGFSNYSLSARRDFVVYFDREPELDRKVYQTIDLGDSLRGVNYSCVVQVFGLNDDSEWVLVQTNPERSVQAKLLGNPDVNQPESLGFFPTQNGVANTYFRNHRIHGYNDFELVIQCVSSFDKLVYEESISTRYIPASRPLVSRGVWLTDRDNAFYVTVWFVGAFFLLWIGGLVWRRYK
jgi:hypothetical protein